MLYRFGNISKETKGVAVEESTKTFRRETVRAIWGAGFHNTNELAFVPDDELLAKGFRHDQVQEIRAIVEFRWSDCPRCGGTGRIGTVT